MTIPWWFAWFVWAALSAALSWLFYLLPLPPYGALYLSLLWPIVLFLLMGLAASFDAKTGTKPGEG
jgi:hypothetical protein